MNFGEFSEELHRKVGEEVVKNSIDILITVGENSKHIAEKAKELGMGSIYICENNEEAINILNKRASRNDAILLKASNGMNFNKILEKLKEG